MHVDFAYFARCLQMMIIVHYIHLLYIEGIVALFFNNQSFLFYAEMLALFLENINGYNLILILHIFLM